MDFRGLGSDLTGDEERLTRIFDSFSCPEVFKVSVHRGEFS